MTTTDALGGPSGAGELFTPCPRCSFGNPVTERTCLFCGAQLPFFDATRRVRRRPVEPAAVEDRAPPPAAPQGAAAPRPAPEPGDDAREGRAQPSSRLRRQAHDAQAPIAFLCCRPLPPLPLGPVPVITIGRSADCHVVLPHLEVSRHHCSIKVRRQHLVIEDEGSSNGTLVNERRVSTADLKVGDVITIGPYVMEVLDEERAAAWEQEDESAAAVDVSHALSGRLDEMPLREVLQQLEFNARTGTLQVASGRRRGQLVLEEGRPLSASFQGLSDEKAVLAMLALEEGRFSFVRTPDLGPRRMSGVTLTALLLESSRRTDEGRAAVSDTDWDLQVEGGERAPSVGAVGPVGPPPRAARLSPVMRPAAAVDPPPAAPPPSADASSAADTVVRDLPEAEALDPYVSAELVAVAVPDEAAPGPGAPDDRGERPAVTPAPGEVLDAEDLRPRSDRFAPLELPPPAPTPARSRPGRMAVLVPWGLVAALAVACAVLVATRPRPGRDPKDELKARAAALTRDVDQALTSPRSIESDLAALSALRGRLAALRANGAPDALLAAADARLTVLEGLAAAARGDAGGVSVALGRTTGADISPAATSALLGAATVVGLSGGHEVAVAIEHLSRAIEGGVVRPELRAWRARLRGRAPIEDVGTAAAILDDLRVVAASIGLSPDDELLRARALLRLGREDEAAPALDALGARHREVSREVALARVEQALARGEAAVAARRVVEAGFGEGDPGPQARALAARARRQAAPLLEDLRRGRALTPARQGRLVDLLRIVRLLGGAPLDDEAAAPLLDALDRPDEPLPATLCLGAAELVGRDSEPARLRVLRRLYRAMERPEPEDRGQANLTLLICFAIGADPTGVVRPADLLARVRDRHALAELYHARALAREDLGRLRDAELDAQRALRLEPERQDLRALHGRLAAAVREASPAPEEPPSPRPLRRVG